MPFGGSTFVNGRLARERIAYTYVFNLRLISRENVISSRLRHAVEQTFRRRGPLATAPAAERVFSLIVPSAS